MQEKIMLCYVMLCMQCNSKVNQKTLINGLCNPCTLKKNFEEDELIIGELSKQQAAIGSKSFWEGMKKFLDAKFGQFQDQMEKLIETKLEEKLLGKMKELIEGENKLLKADIEALKDENREFEEKLQKLEKDVADLKTSIEMTDQTMLKTKNGLEKNAKRKLRGAEKSRKRKPGMGRRG